MKTRGWVWLLLFSACEVPLTTKVETGFLDETDADVDADADADIDTDTDTDADTDTGPGTIPGISSIYDIQSGYIPITAEVTVEGIVTATAYNGLYIQDPAGGPRSGIWIYTDPDWPILFAPAAVGDRVRVSGQYNEFLDLSQISLPDSASPSLANLGFAEVLPAEVLRVPELGEEWESVLVRIEDVTVANPDIGFGEFSVVDAAGNPAIVDNQIHWFAPAADGTLLIGTALSAVTGPLNYAFGSFKIEPRGAFDLLLVGEETGDTGVIVATGQTAETADTGNTAATGQTAETGDTGIAATGQTADTSADTGTIDTSDTASGVDTADTGTDTGTVAPTGDTGAGAGTDAGTGTDTGSAPSSG